MYSAFTPQFAFKGLHVEPVPWKEEASLVDL